MKKAVVSGLKKVIPLSVSVSSDVMGPGWKRKMIAMRK